MNQFDRDVAELGWRAAMALWLENRTTGPITLGWTDREQEHHWLAQEVA